MSAAQAAATAAEATAKEAADQVAALKAKEVAAEAATNQNPTLAFICMQSKEKLSWIGLSKISVYGDRVHGEAVHASHSLILTGYSTLYS